MKKLLFSLFVISAFTVRAQNFEGIITWKMTTEITDPKMKAQMEEAQKKMNDPANQAQMKEMQGEDERSGIQEDDGLQSAIESSDGIGDENDAGRWQYEFNGAKWICGEDQKSRRGDFDGHGNDEDGDAVFAR
jgi:hypothetical protein